MHEKESLTVPCQTESSRVDALERERVSCLGRLVKDLGISSRDGVEYLTNRFESFKAEFPVSINVSTRVSDISGWTRNAFVFLHDGFLMLQSPNTNFYLPFLESSPRDSFSRSQ